MVNLAQSLIESVLAFHPAVWWTSARVRLEREICCDAELVARTGDPAAYADLLATAAMTPCPAPFSQAAAMAEHNVVTRVRILLGRKTRIPVSIAMKRFG
ncbi:M56 family metallopeptidase (plasmid) [Isosphaeraceae bacterium EP7]